MSALADQTPAYPVPADAAARTLYERYSNRIFRYCLQRLRSVEEAEDAAQTAFLYAFVGLRRGVEPEFEVAWLYKIAENVCRTRLRSRARRGRFETSGDLFELLDLVPAADRSSNEQIEALPEVLAGMPASQRRALLLREVQGMSYREIADQLRTSVSAVETLLFRARRSCARELERLARSGEKVLSAASLLSAIKSLASRYLAASSGAKVAVIAAAAATGGVLAVTPQLVHATKGKAPVMSRPGSFPVGAVPLSATIGFRAAEAGIRARPSAEASSKAHTGRTGGAQEQATSSAQPTRAEPSNAAPAPTPTTPGKTPPSAPGEPAPAASAPKTSPPTGSLPLPDPPAGRAPPLPQLPSLLPPPVQLPPPPSLPVVPPLPQAPPVPPLPPPPHIGLP
jgi:RNA polymerase sigma-70 factor (ECF subfamily)